MIKGKAPYITIPVIATLIMCFYAYLVYAPIKPGVSGRFYDFKRSIQEWHYGTLMHDPNMIKLRWNPTPIDIVIPVVGKDYESLVWAVKNIRIFAMHNIGDIYLVAPANEMIIKDFARDNDCIFIDEYSILPKFSKKITYGWIIQQFIKLNADTFVRNENFLVLDADTILIRPTTFLRKGKLLLQFHNNYSPSRKKFVADVLHVQKVHNLDFTAHHMLFSKNKLSHMKQHIEETHNLPWYEVIVMQPDVAEYELYANFMLSFYPEQTRIVPAKNYTIIREQFRKGFEQMQNSLNHKYKSISAHAFLQEDEL